ncbi:MAG: NAD(P)H-hydrate dehydratase [Candidatus Latescibacteria bacterium]|nr:NAD(P)H-hydrate dehydratase [Candidatus Latescibacterota bacterium]
MDFPRLVTSKEMAQLDQRAIREGGVSGAELMERAGARVVEAIRQRWEGLEDLEVVVVCGKGNNGGDGLVVGRLLRRAGVGVQVFLAAPRQAVQGEARYQLTKMEEAGLQALPLLGEEDLLALGRALEGADLAVDALLGTGSRGAPRPEFHRIIERLGQAGRPVVAVDLPSGLEADTGQVPGACVRAVLTVTFGLPKIGQLFYPGKSYCGTLVVADIGLPVPVPGPETVHLISGEEVARLIPRRPPDAHKGSCGLAVVVAGSAGMTGAAALAADSALLSGAGKVILGAPASLHDLLEVKLTEVMTRPLPEVRRHRCLSLRALGEILPLLSGAQCLALGPGLGRHRETGELVRRLLGRAGVPVVLDADGLNAFAGQADKLKDCPAQLVLTPHAGEFARLSGMEMQEVRRDLLGAARRFATGHRLVLVLKGAPTLVALADGRVMVNPTGNPGMATAGAGDVLTGLIAGLIAQGVTPESAACAGVYLHGAAGDLARNQQGEWGMKAGDISRALPRALVEVADCS